MSEIVDPYLFGPEQEKVSIKIRDLDFEESFREWMDNYILFPKNPAAAAPLHRFFPPGKWEYRFLVEKGVTGVPQDCGILYVRVDSGEKWHLLEFDTMTTDDYAYLTGLFRKLFPEMNIMTPEQNQEKHLNAELWNLHFADAPVETELCDHIHHLDPADYALLKEHFLKRKADYIIPGSVDIDYERLYGIINSEFIEALLQKARKERDDARRDLVLHGMRNGTVQIIPDPNGDGEHGPVAKIGDYWFYFPGSDLEDFTVDEYLSRVREESLAKDIVSAIDGLWETERNYYYAVLEEALTAKR